MLVLLGISLRLVPHLPNVVPVVAIALFAGVYLNKRYAPWLALALMMISDVMLGLHNVALFTYGSVVAIAFLGIWLRNRKTISRVIGTSLASSLLFFVVTNFGVWLMGWYPRTLEGLINCYTLAIPFFRNMLLGDLAYVAIFFGAYELIASRVKSTKLATVLLSK
ncbi:MAG: hypothetical protein Q8N14_06715 [Candidatus Omnitrophota bacterium]|nr:hypothetical protein [Candidatus Omnitrophota bacterium]